MLSDAEYREILQRRQVLHGIMEGGERDEVKFETMAKAAHVRRETAEASLQLYINRLSGDVKEYEEAHPPEEVK